MFQPEYLYTDLNYLYHHAPVLLNFLLPEFTVLGSLDLTGNLYLSSPVTDYIPDLVISTHFEGQKMDISQPQIVFH